MANKIEKAIEGIILALEQIEPKERAEAAQKVIEKYEDFFLQPASSRSGNHGCYPGGLAVHSYNVLQTAIKLAKALKYKNISSVILCSIFHDLGKIHSYEMTNGRYRRKKEHLPHSAQSIKLLQDVGLTLSEEEFQAIMMHNGLYTDMGRETKCREFQLTYIVHWADMWSAFVIKE